MTENSGTQQAPDLIDKSIPQKTFEEVLSELPQWLIDLSSNAGDIDEPSQEANGVSPAGFVYLVAAKNGMYKIGKAINVSARVGAIQRFSPVKLRVAATAYTANAYKLEHSLHLIFQKRRKWGEWFKLSGADVERILRYFTSEAAKSDRTIDEIRGDIFSLD